MAQTGKIRYTVVVFKPGYRESHFCVFTDIGQAEKLRDVLNRKLAGKGYHADVSPVWPQRSAKNIMDSLGIN